MPIAGGFWNSNPETCPAGPVNVRHIHGQKDRVVAYGEIGIYNSMPIPEGLEILRTLNGCRNKSDHLARVGRFECSAWTSCTSGRRLEVCLHPKGHSIPAEWVGEGYDWMVGLE